MIPNPIRKVLSSIRKHRVRALLMGGQACVFYGAAEFSRDIDFAILANGTNFARLKNALAELDAEVIAVPPFSLKYLRKGHAVHFRCRHPEAAGLRIDLMTKMRGVDSFSKLWARRTTMALPDGTRCDLLSLPDLVQAKKTQRDKDWPMLRRLVEAHFFDHARTHRSAHVKFWLRELRTPELLIEATRKAPVAARRLTSRRPLLHQALAGDARALQVALRREEELERASDRGYWKPLKVELESLRHAKA